MSIVQNEENENHYYSPDKVKLSTSLQENLQSL